jgi:hypothetical protein
MQELEEVCTSMLWGVGGLHGLGLAVKMSEPHQPLIRYNVSQKIGVFSGAA